MIRKIKDASATIKQIMIDCEATRDDDRLLLVKYWCEQNPNLRSNRDNITVGEFFDGFLKYTYADPETIRRTRQKIQQHNPHLRGTGRCIRKYQGEQMRFEIGNLKP